MVDGLGKVRERVRGPLAADDPRVIALLRETFLDTPSSLPYNLSTDPAYNKYKHKGTWQFIHDITEKLFGEQRGGFFVEAGALDGEKSSNTLWLEQELGWTGLLVEPNPSTYNNLLRKRRKAWSSCTCLSPEPYPVELILVSTGRKRVTYSRYLDNADTHRGGTHLLGVDLDSHIFDKYLQTSDESYYKTQCFPLVSYLRALNVSTVDFLSLDVQGAERSILYNLPWDSLTIRVIVVEVVDHDVFMRDFFRFFMEKKYILVADGFMDHIFVREDDPVLKNVNVNILYTESSFA